MRMVEKLCTVLLIMRTRVCGGVIGGSSAMRFSIIRGYKGKCVSGEEDVSNRVSMRY